MILGSHNSWSFRTPTQWWLKPLRFTAQCQDLSLEEQYNFGVRCFDLRIRFDKKNNPIIAHGIIEYGKLSDNDLKYLNNKKDVCIRLIHEVRTKKQYTEKSKNLFINLCKDLLTKYSNIKFWCGRNLYNWEIDYKFDYNPTCKEIYSSVCSPKLVDDWYPRLFAKVNNKNIIPCEEDILLVDFINYLNYENINSL